MIQNGKEISSDFKRAAQIQDKINNINQIPDSAKVEVSKNDKKELLNIIDNDYNSYGAYGIQNNTLIDGVDNSIEKRKERYETYNQMDGSNFLHRGLSIIADDCNQKNTEGHTLKVFSDDDEIKEILEELFYDRLGVDKSSWDTTFETCKNGDAFYEVIPDSYTNPTMISRIRYLEPDRVNRIEKNGKLAFYTYTADPYDETNDIYQMNDKKEDQKVIYKLEPWQIVHFRIPTKEKGIYPYGRSLLHSGVETHKDYAMLKNGMLIYRLARVPERRVFKIDCGNLPQNEALRQVQRIKDNYRTTQILDDKGNVNRTASALSLTQDIFIPVRDGGKGTEVTSLGAGTALNNIDDIKFFRDELMWTLNIPPERYGTTSDQSGGTSGRGSLAMQDITFSRFCERIQADIEDGYTKLAAIELFFKHKKKTDLKNFRLELTPPSNIKEVMDVEFINQKMQLIQSMNSTGMFPRKFILEHVLKLSKKEINNLIFFKDMEAQAGANQENAMLGAAGMPTLGGAGISNDTGTGLPPAPPSDTAATSAPVAASISTDDLSEKLINICGKKVLIEHKDDIVKLFKAVDDYNKEIESKKIVEGISNEEFNSILMEEISNVFVKEQKATGTSAINLIYESELDGLNFEENSFKYFGSEPAKAPKNSKKGVNTILQEQVEKTVIL